MSDSIKAVDWVDDALVLLDQTLIPVEERYRSYTDVDAIIDAIKRLVVRGAPAIGVAGAFGVVIAMDEAKRNGSRLPVTALVDQFYADVQKMGGNRWDTSSLIKRLK